MTPLLIFIIAIIIILLFIRFDYGISAYLAFTILVPYLKINLFGVDVQWNGMNSIVLVSFLIEYSRKYYKNKLDFNPLIPFLFFFFSSLIIIPFQQYVPTDWALSTLRGQFMKYLILPFVIWNQMRFRRESIKEYRYVILICIGITLIYGLFLTNSFGINPYIMYFTNLRGSEYNQDWLYAGDDGRLFGRISSVFIHPMTYGLFLGLSVIYITAIRKLIGRVIFSIFFVVSILSVIICGVRSSIAGVAIALIFYLLIHRNFKLMIIALFLSIIGWYVLLQIPDLSSYLQSVVNSDSQDVVGSSVEMRISQFDGCLKEVEDCYIIGKGFNWSNYYMMLKTRHPILLAFESLIFVVICNGGIVGVLIWITMIVLTAKFNIKYCKNGSDLLNSLLVFYVAYSCITGEYGYMQFYILFYVLILGEILTINKNSSHYRRKTVI